MYQKINLATNINFKDKNDNWPKFKKYNLILIKKVCFDCINIVQFTYRKMLTTMHNREKTKLVDGISQELRLTTYHHSSQITLTNYNQVQVQL